MRLSLRGFGGAALVVVVAACGSDTTPGGATDTNANDIGGDTGVDTSPPDQDTGSGADVATDPDGTRYPIAATTGVIDGTFETRKEAAFNGVVDEALASAATTEIYENIEAPPLLYKEFDCETRLRRVEVHPPTGGHLLHHPTNYPNGGTGTVEVVGRRAESDFWYNLTSKPYAATGPVIFGPDELGNSADYVAYGVRFTKDEPLIGSLHVAEVSLFGYCAGPNHTIAWETTDWLCVGVECVAASNPGGLEERTVTCARDAGGFAHPDYCEGEEPASDGEPCNLECPHSLVYVGPRGFTYDNGSGWLHEGGSAFRAGPLPSEVEFGTTVDAIAGKPCSILTEDPRTFFVGISCVESPEGAAETLYCAFRCE